jgi:hypothetical protein
MVASPNGAQLQIPQSDEEFEQLFQAQERAHDYGPEVTDKIDELQNTWLTIENYWGPRFSEEYQANSYQIGGYYTIYNDGEKATEASDVAFIAWISGNAAERFGEPHVLAAVQRPNFALQMLIQKQGLKGGKTFWNAQFRLVKYTQPAELPFE